jgi:putative hemin transport protein
MDDTPKLQTGGDDSIADAEALAINEELIERRDALLAAEPKLRGRALAIRLGVSEVQILMLDGGRSTRLLRPEWHEIIRRVCGLGTVMAFTRNEWILHEKIGRYSDLALHDSGKAMVVGEEINLRLSFDQWRFGFAVKEGILMSLQFFDRFGSAVHKVYLLNDSDPKAFARLVGAYQCRPGDFPFVIETPPPVPVQHHPDFAIDIESFWSDWDSQCDPHEFGNLLAGYGLRHIQAFRLAGDKRARQLPARVFARSLEMAAERAAPVVIQIENRGAIQMHAGTISNVSRGGRWLNVIDPAFNLHLFEEAVAESWAVNRPTARGPVLALEAIDVAGNSIATIFGMAREHDADRQWSEIVKSFY